MKLKTPKISTLAVVVISTLSLLTLVSAANFLPDSLAALLGLVGPSGICASDYITSRVQFVLVLALGGIILVAVVYAMMAAYKYVSSQGESGKMEEAQKSIKAIFIGVAAMIIAIVGIILVFAVFGAKPADPSLYQTCINEPTGLACASCKSVGYASGSACEACEDVIKAFCNQPTSTDTSKTYLPWKTLKDLVIPVTKGTTTTDVKIGTACK